MGSRTIMYCFDASMNHIARVKVAEALGNIRKLSNRINAGSTKME